MKFGEALPQRSVPEWLPCELPYFFSPFVPSISLSRVASRGRLLINRPNHLDNLDYNEIKQLIKRYTTGKSLVPTAEAKTAFEDEFFEVFMDQLGRVLDPSCGALSRPQQQRLIVNLD